MFSPGLGILSSYTPNGVVVGRINLLRWSISMSLFDSSGDAQVRSLKYTVIAETENSRLLR